ncbi:Histidine kinase [Paenimyroides ummariense]|uniref:Histidine kinase n=2 Tax=Paenimyroides ummariense TaxID=913024 RepID=A0A1I5DL80_9FLAO|nr:Histidine kinase [Paenimyroides ummariense]
MVRLVLNLIFTGLILWAALANNSGKEIAVVHILAYNLLIFIPGWINIFYLLPKLLRNKKPVPYFFYLLVSFLALCVVLGQYLQWLFTKYHTNELDTFTPLAISSSAPNFLNNVQYYFDAFPAVAIVITALMIGYVVREFLLKLKTEKEIKSRQTVAELSLLKSQISPHFLFNMLNSLYALSLRKSDDTPGVILQLSDILRYSLYETREREVDVLDEIAIIETYLAIQKIRISETAHIFFTHKGISAADRIAPMLLLPLIENAFKHGVDSTAGDSYIDAAVFKHEDRLVFTCENNYKESKESIVGGIGIENIQKRLQLIYPSRYKLDIKRSAGVFRITLSILI